MKISSDELLTRGCQGKIVLREKIWLSAEQLLMRNTGEV